MDAPTSLVPNYERPCENCEQVPTVDVYEGDKLGWHMDLCGPCAFGEADAIDPENW